MTNIYSPELMTYLNLTSNIKLTELELLNYVLNKCNKTSFSTYDMPFALYKIIYQTDDNYNVNDSISLNKNNIKRRLKNHIIKNDSNQGYVSVSNIYSDTVVTSVDITI